MPPSRFLEPDLPADGGAYRPSLFRGDFLNDRHRRIGELVESVPGKLRHADELKLYEMAYMARGPILEVGTDRGRSLAILAFAARDAGRGHPIFSIDILEESQESARANLARLGLLEFVTLINGDSSSVIATGESSFDLVFIDGDHTHDGVKRDLAALQGKVLPGGAIVFHDYYDPRNNDPDDVQYGVSQAVAGAVDENRIRFRGGCGAVGVYEQL